MGNIKSTAKTQETGLIQGSVISVTLFFIAVNDLLDKTGDNVQKGTYADDLTLLMTEKNIKEMTLTMQFEIEKATKIAQKIGCESSPETTIAMRFSQSRKKQETPALKCGNKKIKFENDHRILGMIFDSRLTWAKHISDIKQRANKKINTLKMLSNQKHGLNYDQLLTLHESIILTTLDYGAEIYDGASKTQLKKLDPVHTTGLRIALGAFKTSPTDNILVEAGFLPLQLRRKIRTAYYAINILQNKRHPQNEKLKINFTKTLHNEKNIFHGQSETNSTRIRNRTPTHNTTNKFTVSTMDRQNTQH